MAPVQVRASAQEQGPVLPPVPLLHIPPRLHRYRAPAHLLAARPTAWAQVQLPAEAQVREQALALPQPVQALPAAVVPVPGLERGPERALPPPAPAARVAEEHVALRHVPSASSSSPPHSSDSEGRRPQ